MIVIQLVAWFAMKQNNAIFVIASQYASYCKCDVIEDVIHYMIPVMQRSMPVFVFAIPVMRVYGLRNAWQNVVKIVLTFMTATTPVAHIPGSLAAFPGASWRRWMIFLTQMFWY